MSWAQHLAQGTVLSRYESVGVSRHGGSTLGCCVLPVGLGMVAHPQVSQIHQAQ